MSSIPDPHTSVPVQPVEAGAEDQPSALERFFEGFLQERNIKWMLGIGAVILLGSSLAFVSAHWEEMAEIWKYAVLLGYAAIIHVCGQAAYHRFALRRTGTALMTIELLLIPVVFFSLNRLSAGAGAQPALMLGFLPVALLFAGLAARRIFRHFLRGDQPSIVASYLILALAGAVVPNLPGAWSPWVAMTAWAVFAFGSVNSSREVFWLTEEHRLPRIFGFFPIGLLGLQFLAIFCIGLYDNLPPTEWIGFGCVLTAIPIMLTANSFAAVFQQRTGDLVRPLPWPIIGPMVLGLVLCVAGLALAATGSLLALAPTAVVFAAMMAVAAHRTGHRGFVWAMLGGVVLGYQFAPAWFASTAQAVVQSAEHAVNETRLPLAWYGLTYLPLLLVGSISTAALARRGDRVFSEPVQTFVFRTSVFLLVASFWNPAANFAVAAVMCGFLMAQALLFGRRGASAIAIIAGVTAAVQLVPFVEQIWRVSLPSETGVFVLGLAALLMQLAGPVDRLLDRRTEAPEGLPAWLANWRDASMPVTIGAVVWWLVAVSPNYVSDPAWISGLLLTSLLAVQSLISSRSGHAVITLMFACLLGGLQIAASGGDFSQLVLFETLALVKMWAFGYAVRNRTDRLSRVFGPAATKLAGMLPVVALGSAVWSIAAYGLNLRACDWLIVGSGLAGIAYCLTGGRLNARLPVVGFGTLLAMQWPIVGELVGREWVPAVWALSSTLGVLATGWLQSRANVTGRTPVCDIETVSLLVLAAVGAASFVFFGFAWSVAGGCALAGLVIQSRVSRNRSLRGFSLAAANWLVLGTLLQWACPDAQSLFDITGRDLLNASVILAAGAAISALLFQHPRVTRMSGEDSLISLREIVETHVGILTVTSAVCLFASLLRAPSGLPTVEILAAVVAFLALALSTFRVAWNRRSERAVVASELVVGLAVPYLWMFGVVSLQAGFAMYALLAVALLCSVGSRLAARAEASAFAARPLARTARVLPLLTVGAALVRWLMGDNGGWLGANSFAVLLAGAYYFWCGVEEKKRGLVALAAAVLNCALFLLWSELKITDPQFFTIPIGVSVIGLVQLLRNEIPAGMRDPLRYAGALIILVSPTFHIVSGSWVDLITLMICSILVALAAIGLRIRPLLYTGTAFLLADIVAMLVRGGIDHPDKLWLAGLAAGAGVIGLAAFFENHREKLLTRVRALAAELQAWD